MANSDASFLDELIFKSCLESTSSELTEHDKSALELLEMLIKEELTKIKDVACQTENAIFDEKKSVGADLKVEKKIYGDQFGNSAFENEIEKISKPKMKYKYKIKRAPWKKYRKFLKKHPVRVSNSTAKKDASFGDKTTIKSFSSYTSEERTNFEISNSKLIPYHSRNTLTDVSWAKKPFNFPLLERSQSEGNYLKSSSMRHLQKQWKNGVNIHAYNVETYTEDFEDELTPKTRPMIIRKESKKNRKSFFYKNSKEEDESEVVNLKIVGDSALKPSAPPLSEFRRPSPNVSKSKLTLTEPKSAKTVLILKGDLDCPIESLKIDNVTVRELRDELLNRQTEEADESGKIKVPACSHASGEGVDLEKIFITSSPSKLGFEANQKDSTSLKEENEISNGESLIKIISLHQPSSKSCKVVNQESPLSMSLNKEIPSIEPSKEISFTPSFEPAKEEKNALVDEIPIENKETPDAEDLKEDIALYKEPLTETPAFVEISKEEISKCNEILIDEVSKEILPDAAPCEASNVDSMRSKTKEFFDKQSKSSSSSSDLLSEICNLKKPRVPRIFDEVKNSKTFQTEMSHSETMSDVISELYKKTNSEIMTMHFRQEERKMVSHSVGGKTMYLPAPEQVKVPISDHYTNPPPPPERAPVARQVQSEHNLDLRQIVPSQQPIYGSENRLELKKEQEKPANEQKETKYLKVLTPTKFRDGNVRSQFKEFFENDDINEELLKYLKSEDTTISESTERSDIKRVEEIKNLTVSLHKNFPPSILKRSTPHESWTDLKPSSAPESKTDIKPPSAPESQTNLKPSPPPQKSRIDLKTDLKPSPPPQKSLIDLKTDLKPSSQPHLKTEEKELRNASTQIEVDSSRCDKMTEYEGNESKNFATKSCGRSGLILKPEFVSERSQVSKSGLYLSGKSELEPPKAAIRDKSYFSGSFWDEKHPLGKYRGIPNNSNLGLLGLKNPKGNLTDNKTNMFVPHENSELKIRNRTSKNLLKQLQNIKQEKTCSVMPEIANTQKEEKKLRKIVKPVFNMPSTSTQEKTLVSKGINKVPNSSDSERTCSEPTMFQKMGNVKEETSEESKDSESEEETDVGSTDSEDLMPTPSVEFGNWQEIGDHRNSILSWQSHDISRPRNKKEIPKEPKNDLKLNENQIPFIPSGVYPTKFINMHLRNRSFEKKSSVRKKEFLIDPDMFKEVLNHVRRMREKYASMVEEAFGRSKQFGKITSFTYPVFPTYDKDMEGSKQPEGSSKQAEASSKQSVGSSKQSVGSNKPEGKSHERPSKAPSKTREGPSKTPERTKSFDSSDKPQAIDSEIDYEKRKDIFYKFLKMMMKKVKEIEDNENLPESPVGAKTEKKVSFSNLNVGDPRKDGVKLDSAVQTSNRNSNKNVQTDIFKKKNAKKKLSEVSQISFSTKKPVFKTKMPISSKSFHSKPESSKRASSRSYSKSTEVGSSRRPSSKSYSTSEVESSKRTSKSPEAPRKSDINITNIKLGNEDIVMSKKPNEAVIILGESGKKESVKISITTQGHEPEKRKKVTMDDVLTHIEGRILERIKSRKPSGRKSPYRETKSSVLKTQRSPTTDLSTKSRKSSMSSKFHETISDSSKSADHKHTKKSADRRSSEQSRKDRKTSDSSSKYESSRTKSSDKSSRKEKKSSDSSSKHENRPRFSSKSKKSSMDESKTKSKSAEKKSSRSKSPERSSKTVKIESIKTSAKKSWDGGKYSSRVYVLGSPKVQDHVAKSPKKSESTRQKSATTSAEIADLSEDSTVVSEKSVRSKYKPVERNLTKYFPRVSSPPGKSVDLPDVPEEDERSEGKGAGLMKIAEPLNHARIRDVLVNGHRVVDERQLKNAISAQIPVEILDKRKNAKILRYYEPEKAKAEEPKSKKPALKVKRKFVKPKVTESKQKTEESTTVNLTDLIEKLALLEKAERLLRQKENGKKKGWKY